MGFKLQKFLAFIFILLGSSISSAAGDEKPPIELPFFPKSAGEVQSFDANIAERLNYSVDIKFHLTKANKWSTLFDNESPEDARRLADLLGAGKFVDGKWIELGVPAKFRVQVIQKIDGKVILDEIVNRPKTSAIYMGRYATLVSINLSAGKYSIRVSYLEGAPELASLHADISFAKAHHGK